MTRVLRHRSHRPEFRRSQRGVVLTDREWLKAIGEHEGALIPGLEIEGSGPSEQAAPEQWLAQGTAPPPEPRSRTSTSRPALPEPAGFSAF